MWWIYALLSAFFAALTAIFVKLGVTNMDSDLATAIRTGIILMLTWAIVWYKGVIHQMPSIDGKNWLFLILSGMATGLSWLFYFRAIKLGDVSKVAPIDKLSVALVIILSALFLQEAITPKIAIGVVLIITGTFLVIMP